MKFFLLLVVAILGVNSSIFAGDIEDRLESLELERDINPFKFSGELTTRMDIISLGKADSLSADGKGDLNFTVHTMRYHLDIKSQLSSDFTAYVRIAGSKLMNDYGSAWDRREWPGESASHYNNDATAYFDRIFFNYNITDSFIFSAGRLPTIDGPPLHLTMNESAMGTYPRMLYGTILDGYALTYSFGDLVLRGIYHPLNTGTTIGGNWSSPKFKPSKETVSKTHGEYRWGKTTADMNALMLDYNIRTSFARKFQAILQSFIFENLVVSDEQSVKNVGKVPADGVISGSSLKGTYRQYNLYLGFEGIFDTGWSIGLSHTITQSESVGDALNDIPAANKPSIGRPGPAVGFMTNELEDSNTGSGSLLTIAYKITSQSLKNPVIALEYLSSDQFYNFWDWSGEDPLLFYANRGTSAKIVYNQPISDSLSTRIGFLTLNQKYSSGFAGEPAELDGITNTNMFVEFKAKF